MAPSGRTTETTTKSSRTKTTTTTTTTTTTRRRRTKQPKRTNFKKQNTKSKKQEILTVLPSSCSSISSQDSSKERDIDVCDVIDVSNSVCSTPKGQKFRIPKISTCPPAPKKPRVLSSNCSLRRSPLSFFAPPDLELFFFSALRDVSV